MCLSIVKNFRSRIKRVEYQEKKWMVGWKLFKIVKGKRHFQYFWLLATGHLEFNTPYYADTLGNTNIVADDGILYPAGFHAYLRKKDAKSHILTENQVPDTYIELRKVLLQDIVATGYQGQQEKVIVGRKMIILEN